MLALAGCLGGDDEAGDPRPKAGDTLTVYSSLPRHGLSAAPASAVAAGQRLALEDARHRAGRFRVRLVELDSTRPGDRIWDPGQVEANAKRAADDPRAVAYLGELDYGGSAVSVPVTNEHGLLQISPTDGLTSLTRTPPGDPRAGPERYYPDERRTFLRLVPNDLLLAEGLLELARADSARSVVLVSDDGIYGRELARQLASRARRDGPVLRRAFELRGSPDSVPELVRDVAEERPDVVLYAGLRSTLLSAFLAELGSRLPGVSLLAPAGGLFPAHRPVPATSPRGMRALTPVRPPDGYGDEARRVLRRLGTGPEALYGYESMRVALAAIDTGRGVRAAVARHALRPGPRRSLLGGYEQRATGDVSEQRFALHRVRDRRFAFERIVP